jgi:hypothetical protein
MGEPLRKLKIDGGDLEPNNEDSFDLDDLLHPAHSRAILAPAGELNHGHFNGPSSAGEPLQSNHR